MIEDWIKERLVIISIIFIISFPFWLVKVVLKKILKK